MPAIFLPPSASSTSRSAITGKDTQTVVNALVKNARKLPQEPYKSLTWDRGKEMAGHKQFTLATDTSVSWLV
jgi:IS30 family transposase